MESLKNELFVLNRLFKSGVLRGEQLKRYIYLIDLIYNKKEF
jgi:hypothetical protein